MRSITDTILWAHLELSPEFLKTKISVNLAYSAKTKAEIFSDLWEGGSVDNEKQVRTLNQANPIQLACPNMHSFLHKIPSWNLREAA